MQLWDPPFAATSTWDPARRHLVLPRHADRPAGAGAAVLDDPQARGRPDYLVTPVEKVGIRVEDAPFVAVDVETGRRRADLRDQRRRPGHGRRRAPDPRRARPADGEPSPYVHVRAGLEALIDRKSFYRLVDLGERRPHDGAEWFGLVSGGTFFPVIPAAELPE